MAFIRYLEVDLSHKGGIVLFVLLGVLWSCSLFGWFGRSDVAHFPFPPLSCAGSYFPWMLSQLRTLWYVLLTPATALNLILQNDSKTCSVGALVPKVFQSSDCHVSFCLGEGRKSATRRNLVPTHYLVAYTFD